jgi:hypothetical protein
MHIEEKQKHPLVGQFFLERDPTGPIRAGRIKSLTREGLYLVQLTHDRTRPTPYGRLVKQDEMTSWELFLTEASWRESFIRS